MVESGRTAGVVGLGFWAPARPGRGRERGGTRVAGDRPIRVGDQAPDFTLSTADGRAVTLSDFRGKSEVVLFFYPKDQSPACTAEACSFRDGYEDFQAAGAEVIGVSSDSVESHRRFRDRRRLPFPLLSDPGGTLRARYGVSRTLGLIPGRATYLIDRAGTVRHIVTSQFNPLRHASETLAVLKTPRSSPPDGCSPAT